MLDKRDRRHGKDLHLFYVMATWHSGWAYCRSLDPVDTLQVRNAARTECWRRRLPDCISRAVLRMWWGCGVRHLLWGAGLLLSDVRGDVILVRRMPACHQQQA